MAGRSGGKRAMGALRSYAELDLTEAVKRELAIAAARKRAGAKMVLRRHTGPLIKHNPFRGIARAASR